MMTNMSEGRRTSTLSIRSGILGLISLLITLIVISVPAAASAQGHIDVPVYGEFWGPEWFSLWQPSSEVFVHGGPPTTTSYSGSFGFFFSADPGTFITIFEPDDAGGSAAYPYIDARIDFFAGKVIVDLAGGGVRESTFTNLGSSIGFWISLDLDNDPATSPYLMVTYYDPNYMDISKIIGTAATFTSHDYPNTSLLYFYNPEAAEFPFAGEIVAGVTPASVPNPLPCSFSGPD